MFPRRLILPSVIWVSMVILPRLHLEVTAGVMYWSLMSSSVISFFGKIGCTSTTSFMVRKLGGYIPDIF